jgi:ribonuclease E
VSPAVADPEQPELPKRLSEGRPSPEAAAAALIRKPKIGDSRPAPPPVPAVAADASTTTEVPARAKKSRRRGGRGRGGQVVDGTLDGETPLVLDEETLEKRRGRERKGRPVGRYMMVAQCRENATQVAVLEGRNLIEHYVSRPADDTTQIHGNIYLGRVQNVLPGMEAAFVDIGTPKNAVLYRGDVQYDAEDVEEKGGSRIEQLLRPGQIVLCQVTKNPIGTKGARLTQEVSMAGRFVVFIPNSSTYGISKRLADDERKRLRKILDDIRPAGRGLIVRTAAEGATAEELRRDVDRLQRQWAQLDALATRSNAPCLLYREPPLALRVMREEFNKDYRGVVIDDPVLYQEVKEYVEALIPELADRVELYDDPTLPVFERHHVHEQLHKALDRKVWLPSGGSVIIERTEALTVIDVNTGKNVGSSNLEETVFRNNLEAADEIARQLRLRDIGGIIVIDFIDMEVKKNRDDVLRAFKEALARDKTRTQVFEMSELGLVEMTRKRVSEGLVESFSATCPTCAGRGFLLDETLLG